MTKPKLLTDKSKTESSLHKDIHRLRKRCDDYRKANESRRLQIKAYASLLDKLLNEKRITKKEIGEFIHKKQMSSVNKAYTNSEGKQ